MRNLFHEIFRSKGINYFSDDVVLLEILKFFDFRADNDMKELGAYVSEDLIETMDFVDHNGRPELITWGLNGKRIDYVRISPEHRRALEKLQNFGVVRKSASGDYSWLYHFVSGYIISDSGIFCTLTLTAQTAYGIKKYLGKYPEFLERYLDHDDPWYGATFYSEIQGGSDLGANVTQATMKDGKWFLEGEDKYFASDAGLADGAIVTAKISPGGIRSIGTFFVPYRKENGELNFTIRRLKNKMGTIAVPSGEVELRGSEAYILGDEGKGIYYAMEILTISRINDALAAVGIARKALWEAYLHAEFREVFGKKLIDQPLMRRDILSLEAKLEAATAISIYSGKLFSEVTSLTPPYDLKYHYARFITHIAKNIAAWTSAEITQYSMEILGGIGFFEEFPMAKFHRDSLVTSIWEGTSNIQSLDMLEAILKKNVLKVFFSDLERMAANVKDKELKLAVEKRIEISKKFYENIRDKKALEVNSKELLRIFGETLSLSLLAEIGSGIQTGRMTGAAKIYEFLLSRDLRLPQDDLFDNIEQIKWMSRNN